MLIQGKILSYGADISEAIEIRRQVFIHELNMDEKEEFDDQDSYAAHVIVYEQGDRINPVATGRIIFDGVNCEIGHIAVLKEYRNRKYGDFAARMLINKAFTSGIHEVSIKTPNSLIDFFRKIGFHIQKEPSGMEDDNESIMILCDRDILTCCHKNS
jgi:predicted GNAT family N-acyltransferase